VGAPIAAGPACRFIGPWWRGLSVRAITQKKRAPKGPFEDT